MALGTRFTEDPREFLQDAGHLLAADPVVGNVVAVATDRAVVEDRAGLARRDHPRWWVTIHDPDGDVVGAAMRTAPFAPHPMFVLPMPRASVDALTEALLERGEGVRGLNGVLPATGQMADRLAAAYGGVASVHEHTRLHELGDLVMPTQPAGRLRPATRDDAPLALTYYLAFFEDAARQAGRDVPHQGAGGVDEASVRQRIDAGSVWLWEDEHGEVVHLTAFSGPAFGVARIGPVYTPEDNRGRGYASATVAALSRWLRERGSRVCLFTDQANPTSNKIYAALGYRPVTEMANLVITTPEPA
ncbi:GNAT family N-acetyltransferase [Nocardioides sp.]|uniref:GNAT family N-acetyltransferase n=1 Tax=Nocardioides sp. TaxID=35761 RepID=UPI0035690CD8